MTDEELRVRAIQELEFYKKDDTFMLADITVDLAIKALEQEPCVDAIDRSKAIMIASGYCHPANVAKELAKLPSVNPQPICEEREKGECPWYA